MMHIMVSFNIAPMKIIKKLSWIIVSSTQVLISTEIVKHDGVFGTKKVIAV